MRLRGWFLGIVSLLVLVTVASAQYQAETVFAIRRPTATTAAAWVTVSGDSGSVAALYPCDNGALADSSGRRIDLTWNASFGGWVAEVDTTNDYSVFYRTGCCSETLAVALQCRRLWGPVWPSALIANPEAFEAGVVDDDAIGADQVTTSELADSAVATANILANAITASRIAADAVGTQEIATDGVGTAEIAALAVGTSELAASSVTGAKMAQDAASVGNVWAWTGATWAPSAAGSGDLTDVGVLGGLDVTDSTGTKPKLKVKTAGINITHLGTNSVGSDEIVADAVGNSELADSSVTAANIPANTILNWHIAADAVRAQEIQANAVNASEIGADQVGSSEIATNAVGTAEIADGSITSTDIQTAGISDTLDFAANVLTPRMILASDTPATGELLTYTAGEFTWSAPGAGSGDNITVNGAAATDADFDDATTAAPAGGVNVKWQKDAGTPNNVSAYLDFGGMIEAMRTKPWFFEDFLGAGNSGAKIWPWTMGALASGTLTSGDGEASHPGIQIITSSTSSNSGANISTLNLNPMLLGGGETFECEFQIKRLTDVSMVIGFTDIMSGATLEEPTDGVYMYIASGGDITGSVTNNGTDARSDTTYTCVVDTWYRARVAVNAGATAGKFKLWNAAGTLLLNETTTATVPTGAGRVTSSGIAVVHENTTANALLWVDYLAQWNTRALTR